MRPIIHLLIALLCTPAFAAAKPGLEGDLGRAGAAPGSRPLGREANQQPLVSYDVMPKAGAAGDPVPGPASATTDASPAQRPAAHRQNRPEIPAVARRDVICFAYYTVNKSVLKLTAQLYPLQYGESREVKLDIKDADAWKTIATSRVTEEDYNNFRQDKTWTAHFRVEKWNDSRSISYRVTALNGMAAYEVAIRANPIGKREIVVAAFTGNSSQDRRLKPDLMANLKAQDPDLLFFSGDQVDDHTDHLGAWLLFGRQFGEIIKDRPMI